MLIYLDMCSLQRPFDDQSQLRILIEAESVRGVIALCESGQVELASSEALEFENGRNPHADRRAHVREVLDRAGHFARISDEVKGRARGMERGGIKPLDALHLASAIEIGADYFCTCDDRLLKRAKAILSGPPKVVSPLELIAEIEP